MTKTARDAADVLRDEGPEGVRARIDRDISGARKAKANKQPPLPFIDMSGWDTIEPPPRQWLIVDYIPLRQVTLLSGAGGIGKSILTLQLLAATVLRREWVGDLFPKPGAAIYLGAEDEEDEIHRRLAAILGYYDVRFADLVTGGFRALAFAGKDAVLAEFDRGGRIKPTTLFKMFHAEAVALRPSTIVIDTAADAFLGDEIKRDQVRQFCALLRRLAIDSNSAVILNSHPSLTGMKSGSGLSGSTHWHNSARARTYFRRPKSDDGETEGEETDSSEQPDDGRRELHFLKNQYGPLAKCLELRWSNGLWLPPKALSKTERQAEAERKADDLFLDLLRRFSEEGRNVCATKGISFAPAIFADEPEAKRAKVGKRALAAAMSRLFETKRLRMVTEGPPSKRRSRIVEVPPNTNGLQQPSSTVPPPSSTGVPPSPLCPLPVVEGGRGLAGNAPPPSTTDPKRGPGGEGLAGVLSAWSAAIGFNQPRTIAQLIDEGDRKLKLGFLTVAAMENGPEIIDPMRLEQWLRDVSDVEIDHLMLRSDGADEKGAPRWTLTLRVEPDQGSPSL